MGEVSNSKVLIIGAGPAGLAVAGALNHRGIKYEIVERASSVGSSWRRHYDRLRLHTIRSLSHLPYMPFSPAVSGYPSRDEMVSYLEKYADEMSINVCFNTCIESVVSVDGSWVASTSEGQYRAKYLVMATGYNRVPNIPEWEGMASFSGHCSHSSDYRNSEAYKGMKVLVIGMGNSGAEIALDLTRSVARVDISVRSALNVVARDPWGIPAQVAGLLLSHLPISLADGVGSLAQWSRYGDLSAYGLRRAEMGAASMLEREGRVALVDIGTMRLLRAGTIQAVPEVSRFFDEGVVFVDGKRSEYDAVIVATGYRAGIRGILKCDGLKLNARALPLEHGGMSAGSKLFFVGFRNALSGQLYNIRLDALSTADAIASSESRSH